MKSTKRILAVLLASVMLLAFAPFALAADGATVTVQHGSTKQFEVYRKYNDQWNTVDKSYVYKDFTSASSGDDKIAKIIDQNGKLMIIGVSIGNTTYTATAADGTTFTGYITVINPAPAVGGGGGGEGGSFSLGNGLSFGGSNLLSGSLFLAVGQNTFTVPKPQGAADGGKWSSANEAILKINADSGQVEAIKPGQTMLRYTVDADVKEIPVYISSDDYTYRVEYYNGLPGANNAYPNYTGYPSVGVTQGYSEHYGRVIIGLKSGVKGDITFSAQGDISVDPNTGYFYKQGAGSNARYGYGYSYAGTGYPEWRGTIIINSPSMGTKYVNVRLT